MARTLPPGLAPHRRTPTFTVGTVPEALTRDHRTAAGTWGVLHVVAGRLRYEEPETGGAVTVDAGATVVIAPQVTHRVSLAAEAAFYVEFWRAASPGAQGPS